MVLQTRPILKILLVLERLFDVIESVLVLDQYLFQLVFRRNLIFLKHPNAHSQRVVDKITVPFDEAAITGKFLLLFSTHRVHDFVYVFILVMPVSVYEEIEDVDHSIQPLVEHVKELHVFLETFGSDVGHF